MLVLLLGLTASLLLGRQVSEAAQVRDEARFRTAVEEAQATLTGHSEQYMLLLDATAGIFVTADAVTSDDFHAYVEQVQLHEQAPAVAGIGFARVVPDGYLDEFEQTVRERHDPSFNVHPRQSSDEHVIVEFFVRGDGQPHTLCGYDLSQDRDFEEALKRARDNGETFVTGPLGMEVPGIDPQSAAFAMVAPVYENAGIPDSLDERRARLTGYIFAPLIPARLVDEIFESRTNRRIEIAVYDGTQENPSNLLTSTVDAKRPEPPRFTHKETTFIAGRPWLTEFSTSAYFESSSPQSVGSYLFASGAIISLLLFVLIHRDTTQRRRSDRVHAALLNRERSARAEAQSAADLLTIAEDAARAGVWEIDVMTGGAKWSESLYRLFGVDPNGFRASLDNWILCIHADDRSLVREAVRTAIDNHAALTVEYRVAHPELGDRWLLQIGRTFGITETGRPVRMAGIILDITARKESEEHQKLLLAELNHRVKNTLAIVQSIATQTSKHSESVNSFRESFEGRLRALAKAHGLATQSHWKSIDLRSLVHLALAPYASDTGDNIVIEGPAVSLRTAAALALSMVLHELSTNAAKYGALSVAGGATFVSWKVLEDKGARVIHLVWRETGGPPVREEGRRGFGSQLIERSVEYDLGGNALIDLRPDGFWCEMVFPLTSSVGAVIAVRAGAPA